MQRNRLAAETSPYLLQHAGNPVDWYPWGEEALAAAKRDDKPILLSVGYSACHWCHVMAHESFEDSATAAIMNASFVNIKVDREERPDIDKIYQLAQQMLTQRPGGWPLTMFLTPGEQQPFFGGTYFPRESRHGMPAFAELLQHVAEYYHTHAEAIRLQGAQLGEAFAQVSSAGDARRAALDGGPLTLARTALEQSFDAQFGGFGRAPKFPHATSIERCLRYWQASAGGGNKDLEALGVASLTLTRMAEGGLYDQLGGGFCRYSVDENWMIPHFEKMLYDNGPLLAVYAQAHLATGEALFRRVANETADWALREMRAPDGGFYSSLDADSEGREGKFYVWTKPDIERALAPSELDAFSRRYGLNRDANFEGEWHLYCCEPVDEIAAALGQSRQWVAAAIDSARAKLLAVRDMRIRPARDEKILTAWNALMIKGLAVAARALDRADLENAATAAVDFIRGRLWREGRLLATARDGRARLPAYLDDYAFLADALLELLQCRWRGADLAFLVELADVLLAKFEDSDKGGFFFTASDHENLIHRSKTFTDESLPAGNGVATAVLCRLGHLLGETRYLQAAERTLQAGWPWMARHGLGAMSMLNALQDFLAPTQIVIIRGGAAGAAQWSRELARSYAPTRMVLAIPDDARSLPQALASRRPSDGTVAYVCTGMTCSAPISDLAALTRELTS